MRARCACVLLAICEGVTQNAVFVSELPSNTNLKVVIQTVGDQAPDAGIIKTTVMSDASIYEPFLIGLVA